MSRPPEGDRPWLKIASSQLPLEANPSRSRWQKIINNRGARIGAAISATIVAVVGIGVLVERVTQREQLPETTPIAGPAIPGVSAEQEKSPGQARLETMLTQNPHLQNWRNNLDGIVLVDVYHELQDGFVGTPKGVNVRNAPDTTAPMAGTPREAGHPFKSRYIFLIETEEKQEVWTIIEELPIPWVTQDNLPVQIILPLFSVVDQYDGEGKSIAFNNPPGKDTRFERFIMGKDGKLQKDRDYDSQRVIP